MTKMHQGSINGTYSRFCKPKKSQPIDGIDVAIKLMNR